MASACLVPLAKSSSLALEEVYLSLQHNLLQVPPSPTEDHFVAPIRWPQAQHRQWLMLTALSPLKRLQNHLVIGFGLHKCTI